MSDVSGFWLSGAALSVVGTPTKLFFLCLQGSPHLCSLQWCKSMIEQNHLSHGQEEIERKIRNQSLLRGQTPTDTKTSHSSMPHLSTSPSPSISPFGGSTLWHVDLWGHLGYKVNIRWGLSCELELSGVSRGHRLSYGKGPCVEYTKLVWVCTRLILGRAHVSLNPQSTNWFLSQRPHGPIKSLRPCLPRPLSGDKKSQCECKHQTKGSVTAHWMSGPSQQM